MAGIVHTTRGGRAGLADLAARVAALEEQLAALQNELPKKRAARAAAPAK